MLDEIGGLDEALGSYCEDVDLNWRARLAGYAVAYAPRAIVYHKISATGGGALASFFVGRNTLWVIAKIIPVDCGRNTGVTSYARSWALRATR
jgi:GT2 family glycosyltransferase